MARSPESNEAFFREVDDEVRRERMTVAARRYGIAAAVVVVLALIVFAAVLGWRAHERSVAGERGERFTAALSELGTGNRAAAKTKLDALAKDGGKGYAALARVTLGDIGIQAGDPAGAARTFTAVAGDASAPQPIRDLALLRATALSFDTLAPQEVIRRLAPLAVPGNPWFGSAGELTAIARMKAGQPREAGQLFAAVARDTGAPASLRERTRQLAGDLGIDTEADAAAPPRAR